MHTIPTSTDHVGERLEKLVIFCISHIRFFARTYIPGQVCFTWYSSSMLVGVPGAYQANRQMRWQCSSPYVGWGRGAQTPYSLTKTTTAPLTEKKHFRHIVIQASQRHKIKKRGAPGCTAISDMQNESYLQVSEHRFHLRWRIRPSNG